MPTYEYLCDACGHKFEKFQSMTAAPLRQCPACRANKVRRLIGTGAGLIFKGSGFYITDYRSESYKEKAKAESGTGSAAPESKSAESKTAESPASNASGESKPKAASNNATPSPATPPPAPKPDIGKAGRKGGRSGS